MRGTSGEHSSFVVAMLILRHGGLPRWPGITGLGVAVVVAVVVSLPAGEPFGLQLASVSLISSVMHLWLPTTVGVCAIWQGFRSP